MRKACCGEGSGVLHAAPRASGVIVAVTRTGTCRHLAIHRRLSAVAAALRSFIGSASVRRRTLVITTGRPSPGRSQTVVSTPPVCWTVWLRIPSPSTTQLGGFTRACPAAEPIQRPQFACLLATTTVNAPGYFPSAGSRVMVVVRISISVRALVLTKCLATRSLITKQSSLAAAGIRTHAQFCTAACLLCPRP